MFNQEIKSIEKRQKRTTYLLYGVSALMILMIPSLEIISCYWKGNEFEQKLYAYDNMILLKIGLFDLTLFGCIFIELIVAVIYFGYLSSKY